MMTSKLYLKRLSIILVSIFLLSIVYIYYFFIHYPLPLTNRISLDAKIKFIKDNIDTTKVDTLIVGSSIGLNNIQGKFLEETSKSCQKVLNLSVYEASTIHVAQLLELINIFPNLKRIIYSAQFTDIWDSSRYKNYDLNSLEKYMTHSLDPVSYIKFIIHNSTNIPFLIQRQLKWETKHTYNNQFTYLGFDSTGSVPLHIYGNDIIEGRWKQPHSIPKSTAKAYNALNNMMKDAYVRKIKYYLIQQPYRQELVLKYPHLKKALEHFYKRGMKIANTHNGYFLSLYKDLPLSDKYFADRSHLNDKGSILTAKAIGSYIDSIEK